MKKKMEARWKNIQPTANPKFIKVQRVINRLPDGRVEVLFIQNANIDPRELIKN